jgi:hypothetical protein
MKVLSLDFFLERKNLFIKRVKNYPILSILEFKEKLIILYQNIINEYINK